MPLGLIFLVVALVLFGISAFINQPYEVWRWRLIPGGLFFWVLSVLVSGVHLGSAGG